MNKLQEQLKTDAVSELTELVEKGNQVLGDIVEKVDGTDRYSLAKLIVGGRTKSVEKMMISRMVKAKGVKLLEQYNQQRELPLEPKKRK